MSDLPPEELVKALRRQAQGESGAFRMLANAKTARQTDRDDYPELTHVGYDWIKPEQTVSWQAAALIERLEARVAELEGAVHAFLAKFDECEPNLTSAFVFQQMHLGAYTGPNFAEELAALRKASKYLAQGEG